MTERVLTPSAPGRRPLAPGSGRGVMVVGHGTADPVGAAETRRVSELVAAVLPGVPVALGFLEVIGPTIPTALETLAAAGCREVVAAPLLLFAAGHAKRDVPEAIAAPAAKLGLTVHRGEPLGCHPAIVELSRRRRYSCADSATPAESTTLVMVGRGSSDPTAPAQLEAFAEATLAGGFRPARLLTGFVAAARPTVPEALRAAVEPIPAGVRRVIVQPHLLFRGHVEEQVSEAVAAAREARPDVEWLQVPRLGPDRLVAEALVERAAEAVWAARGTV
jgi:sirohydrochlorin cobaltochelatase